MLSYVSKPIAPVAITLAPCGRVAPRNLHCGTPSDRKCNIPLVSEPLVTNTYEVSPMTDKESG